MITGQNPALCVPGHFSVLSAAAWEALPSSGCVLVGRELFRGQGRGFQQGGWQERECEEAVEARMRGGRKCWQVSMREGTRQMLQGLVSVGLALDFSQAH